jgi:hypothetical protein
MSLILHRYHVINCSISNIYRQCRGLYIRGAEGDQDPEPVPAPRVPPLRRLGSRNILNDYWIQRNI